MASEVILASKQPRRSDLTSNLKSAASITLVGEAVGPLIGSYGVNDEEKKKKKEEEVLRSIDLRSSTQVKK